LGGIKWSIFEAENVYIFEGEKKKHKAWASGKMKESAGKKIKGPWRYEKRVVLSRRGMGCNLSKEGIADVGEAML